MELSRRPIRALSLAYVLILIVDADIPNVPLVILSAAVNEISFCAVHILQFSGSARAFISASSETRSRFLWSDDVTYFATIYFFDVKDRKLAYNINGGFF